MAQKTILCMRGFGSSTTINTSPTDVYLFFHERCGPRMWQSITVAQYKKGAVSAAGVSGQTDRWLVGNQDVNLNNHAAASAQGLR